MRHSLPFLRVLCVLCVMLFFVGCTQSGGVPAASADLTLTTQLVAEGFDKPLFLTSPPGDSRLFVVEQVSAQIRIIKDGKVLPEPFLDLDEKVTNRGGEMGLLGLAFHPKYAENGYFYVNYTNEFNRENPRKTIVERYTVARDNPDKADPASAKLIFRTGQPYGNHNGGMIAFGPAGYLHIGMGDGGAANDPENRSQNDQELLGKMLRIDVDGGDPYGIPPTNPFAKTPDKGKPEIWAKGVRNPWRFSFDRATGDCYIADVGQNKFEEISIMPAGVPGLNFGWRLMEGLHCFNPPEDCNPGDLVLPVHEYNHSQGTSITGGYVYRGKVIPEAQGLYFFADFTRGRIWTFRLKDGKATEVTERTEELAPYEKNRKINLIPSFGEDKDGELYVVDYMDGEIYQIIPRKKAP